MVKCCYIHAICHGFSVAGGLAQKEKAGSRGNRALFRLEDLKRDSMMEIIMKHRLLPFLAMAACLSSAVAQAPFPLPIPTRPTSFPLPIPTRPTNAGYAIALGSTTALTGREQGTLSQISGEVVLSSTGQAFSVSGGSTAALLMPTNLVRLNYGNSSLAGLRANGEVVVAGTEWLSSSNGNTVQIDPSGLVPANAKQDVVAVAHAGSYPGGKWLALKSSGEVISWEIPDRHEYINNSNQPIPYYPVPANAQSGVVAISMAQEHCLALKSSGEVVAWGRVAVASVPGMYPGQNYLEYTNAEAILPQEVANGVVAIAAGPHNGIAIKQDGSLVQWGKHVANMGMGTSVVDLQPIPSELAAKTIVSVQADKSSSLVVALTSEGDAFMWGTTGNYSSTPLALSLKGRSLFAVSPGWGQSIMALSVSDEESYSDLVGYPLDKLAQLVAQKILAHTNNYGLATKPDLLSAVQQAAADGEQQGIASVQSAPNSFNLYSSTQYEANRIAGVAEGKAEVTSNPTAYNLFNESSIMDMNLGSLMLKKGANANSLDLELTIETKDNLATNGWQVAERISRSVSMAGVQRQFLRVRADAPYVAPNVKVLSHPTLGNILTDGAGRVLYFFAADSPGGNPMFSGSSWPYVSVPAAPKADAGVTATLGSSSFGRTNGPFLTVNTRPAYTYVGDTTAGQANGHGSGWVWYTIKADGTINQ